MYGLRVFDNKGNLVVDTNTTLSMYKYHTETNNNGSVNLSDITGRTTFEITIPIQENYFYGGHTISRVDDTISWTKSPAFGNRDTSCTNLIYIFYA
jgi:hypothetical protein